MFIHNPTKSIYRSYGSVFMPSRRELRELLKGKGVKSRVCNALFHSGYYFVKAFPPGEGELEDCIGDGFYGSKWGIGLIPVPWFLEYLKSGEFRTDDYPLWRYPTYYIRSTQHAIDLLGAKKHRKWFSAGKMCFRGQLQQYRTKRQQPNPAVCDNNGAEPLVIPSCYRSFHNNWNSRPLGGPESIFNSIYAHELIYRGIEGSETLPYKNLAKYGPHSMSDLEDMPEPENREYFRRWKIYKIDETWKHELPLLEQHYGLPTAGLDVTFDLRTALFFATHQFTVNAKGKAAYVPCGGKGRILYCFVFTDPPVTRTIDGVRKIALFDHMSPVRPLKQQCALPGFDGSNFNEAITEIDALLILDENFEMTGLPTQEELFPSRQSDGFYDALLELKAKYPDIFKDVVDYEFGKN